MQEAVIIRWEYRFFKASSKSAAVEWEHGPGLRWHPVNCVEASWPAANHTETKLSGICGVGAILREKPKAFPQAGRRACPEKKCTA